MSKKKILYVAGYGRSGSTLLCAVLGGMNAAVPVGELKIIFAHYVLNSSCSCGSGINDCEFWSSVISDFQKENPGISLQEAAEISEKMETFTNWFSLRYRDSELERRYQTIWRSMIDIICHHSNCNIIIDASKSSSIACNRVAVMSKFLDVEHIHLVRDPRAVMASTLAAQKRRLERHGIKTTPFRGVRTLLSWSSTNAYIHLMSLLGLQRVRCRVSYDGLTNNPEDTLIEISDSLSIDMGPAIEKQKNGEPFLANHIFSGDLQRMKGEYHIKAQQPKWRLQLTLLQRVTAWITYPLARMYGFLKVR